MCIFPFSLLFQLNENLSKNQLQYSFLGKCLDPFKVRTRNISDNLIFGHGFVWKKSRFFEVNVYQLLGIGFKVRGKLRSQFKLGNELGKTYGKMEFYKGNIFQFTFLIQVYMSISISLEILSFSHSFKGRRNSGIFP